MVIPLKSVLIFLKKHKLIQMYILKQGYYSLLKLKLKSKPENTWNKITHKQT